MFYDAHLSDAIEIAAVINLADRGPGSWTDDRHLLEGDSIGCREIFSRLKSGRFLISRSEPGGQISACVHISESEPDVWDLSLLAATPSGQRRALASLIIGEVHRQAVCDDVQCLRMVVTQQKELLIAWLERFGFRRKRALLPLSKDDPDVCPPHVDDLFLIVLEKELSSRTADSCHPNPPYRLPTRSIRPFSEGNGLEALDLQAGWDGRPKGKASRVLRYICDKLGYF